VPGAAVRAAADPDAALAAAGSALAAHARVHLPFEDARTLLVAGTVRRRARRRREARESLEAARARFTELGAPPWPTAPPPSSGASAGAPPPRMRSRSPNGASPSTSPPA
jgi:hypothetical protein